MPCTEPLGLAPQLAGNFKAALRQGGFRRPRRCRRRDRDRDLQHPSSGPQRSSVPPAALPGPVLPGPGRRPPRTGQQAGSPCPPPRKLRSPPRLAYLWQKAAGEGGRGKEEQDFRSLQLSFLSPALRSLSCLLSLSFLPSCPHTPPPRCSPASRKPRPRRGARSLAPSLLPSLPPALPQKAAAPRRGRAAPAAPRPGRRGGRSGRARRAAYFLRSQEEARSQPRASALGALAAPAHRFTAARVPPARSRGWGGDGAPSLRGSRQPGQRAKGFFPPPPPPAAHGATLRAGAAGAREQYRLTVVAQLLRDHLL